MSDKIKLPETMSHKAQKEMFKANPEWKELWDYWKLKTITAKDAGTEYDVIVVGIDSDGSLIGKLKIPRGVMGSGEVPLDSWSSHVLNDTEFILAKYKRTDARYTFNFNYTDDGN